MSKNKSKTNMTDKTRRNINILHFQRELEQVKNQKENNGYSPKLGRKIKQIEKKLKKIA